LAQKSQQKTECGAAISRVDWMGLGAPTVWQMTAHEPLHKRLANIMLSGVSAMVRPENVENDLDVARTIADTPPLN
jgi:hypothetical protein